MAQELDSETAVPLLGEAKARSWVQCSRDTVEYWLLPLAVITLGLTVSGMALAPMLKGAAAAAANPL